jgi:putative membrane protein
MQIARPTTAVFAAVALTVISASRVAAQTKPAAPSPKLDDPTIVAIFDNANTWDIATGGLGAKKGTTKEIRDFGAQLERDHTTVRQQGRDLAKKLGVKVPALPKDFQMKKDHDAAMKRLEGLSGKAFDRAFLQHEVDFHKAVIDAVNTTLMPALQNQEVKDLVTKVAPAFKAHEDMAQNLLDKATP